MDPLTIAAASGLRSRMQSLDLLANNLANAATAGFKSDREFYGLYASEEAGDPSSTLPVVERQWTDFSQGTLQPTGNPLDLALSGSGFFVFSGRGGPLYTRNGSLHVSAANELVNGDGYVIRGAGGSPIRVEPGKPIEIASDGTVRQDKQEVGRLEIVDFQTPSALTKMTGNYFQNADPKNSVVPAAAEVQQGKVESSNVAVPEAAMRLVGAMRQFEMLQKAVGISAEMNRKSTEEVARV